MPVVTTLHTVLREPKADQRPGDGRDKSHSQPGWWSCPERGRQMLAGYLPCSAGKDRSHPARHSRHRFSSIRLISRTSSGGRQGGDADVRPAFRRTKASNTFSNALPQILGGVSRGCLHCPRRHSSNLLREHGEAYRLSLEILAKKNKIDKNVIFYNQFVDLESLKEFIGAADLYITPYLNEAQITSGTLAYAFGSGKAVISTPLLARRGIAGGRPWRVGAIRRRAGHCTGGDRVAAGRHPPPCHSQETLT